MLVCTSFLCVCVCVYIMCVYTLCVLTCVVLSLTSLAVVPYPQSLFTDHFTHALSFIINTFHFFFFMCFFLHVVYLPTYLSRHAGYSYCGACGGFAYRQVDPSNV